MTEKEARAKILRYVREYYKSFHFKSTDFKIGEKIPYSGRIYDEREMVNLVDSSLDFWLTYGRYSKLFEEKLSTLLNIRYCYLVNSGSSANLLAFMALTSDILGPRKIQRGDEIITVAAGFPTTVAPIVQYGAIPVFVDITIPEYNIDCSLLDKAISSKTKAVMLAHTLGNPFPIKKILDFCKKNNLWLIEDNCDALGSTYQGEYTGTFGDIATSSFYPPHHITMGEGGAIYTNNKVLADIILSLRDWGRDCQCPSGKDNFCGNRFNKSFENLPSGYDHKYVYSHFGYNLKATDMQASIGVAQLDKLQDFIVARKKNFSRLKELLNSYQDFFILPQAHANSDPSWFGFLITLQNDIPFNRDNIVQVLEKNHIQTRMLFAGNLTKQPCFDTMRKTGAGYRIVGDLKNTDKVMRDSFWIGIYPGLDDAMIQYVAQTILSLINKRKK